MKYWCKATSNVPALQNDLHSWKSRIFFPTKSFWSCQ